MSAENSPTFITSDDEDTVSMKRKLDPIPPSEDAKPEKSVNAKEPLKKPRLLGGFSLVGYGVDDEDDDESKKMVDEETGELDEAEKASDEDETIEINRQFIISDGPVTVFSSEHKLNDIQQAVESPVPLATTVAEVEMTPVNSNYANENDNVLASNLESTLPEPELPPEPSGHCSMALQEKVEKVIRRMQYDISYDPNRTIQDNKAFRNPSIYEKLVAFMKIDEKGTNFSPDVYDPYRWNSHSFYDKLAEIQNREIDRLEKLRKERRKAEAAISVPATTGISSAGSSATVTNLSRTTSGPALSMSTSNSAEVKKRSKWDTYVAPPSVSSGEANHGPQMQHPSDSTNLNPTVQKVSIPAVGNLFQKKI